ncbi:MAG TPA: ArsA-related P-loop ATPase [Polyangiales bacterium]|nr:ArsA-related P-loop ATPase [Polyangiales bacterium]
MKSPFDLKFVFVVGKGGVGKSSVSAALALAAASSGKRVLLAMCNAKERVSYLLQTEPVGPQIRRIAPNLDAVNMQPEAALEEYGMLILKVRALYRLIFENRFVSAFLHGTPGIDAWAMLGKAQYHAFEKDASGRDRYDLVIVDAPATGHGLDLLRVPRVIVDVAPPGLLRREAERAWQLFRDPERAGVLLVTLPEDMPTQETLELAAAVRDELGLPVAGVITNQALTPLFRDDEHALLEALPDELPAQSALAPYARASRARSEREQAQAACLERLRAGIAAPQLTLPLIRSADFRKREIELLAGELKRGW